MRKIIEIGFDEDELKVLSLITAGLKPVGFTERQILRELNKKFKEASSECNCQD